MPTESSPCGRSAWNQCTEAIATGTCTTNDTMTGIHRLAQRGMRHSGGSGRRARRTTARGGASTSPRRTAALLASGSRAVTPDGGRAGSDMARCYAGAPRHPLPGARILPREYGGHTRGMAAGSIDEYLAEHRPRRGAIARCARWSTSSSRRVESIAYGMPTFAAPGTTASTSAPGRSTSASTRSASPEAADRCAPRRTPCDCARRPLDEQLRGAAGVPARALGA